MCERERARESERERERESERERERERESWKLSCSSNKCLISESWQPLIIMNVCCLEKRSFDILIITTSVIHYNAQYEKWTFISRFAKNYIV